MARPDDTGAGPASVANSGFHAGDPVWVLQDDGSQRPAEYVGEAEVSSWMGGPARVYVVYADTRTGGSVEADRVMSRPAEGSGPR